MNGTGTVLWVSWICDALNVALNFQPVRMASAWRAKGKKMALPAAKADEF